jgi:hypothetical protein
MPNTRTKTFMLTVMVATYFVVLLHNSAVHAQPISLSTVVSSYYSFSSLGGRDHTRSYTTSPAVDRQISIDLAVVKAQYTAPRVSATVALQAGTWADVNYVGGDESWKYINQATVGGNIDSTWWIRVGIMPSHIGQESPVSKDNLLFSRSMIADATPYYSTGAQFGWTPGRNLDVFLYVLNGWQRIFETNNSLSFGSQLVFKPTPRTTVNWSTYLGNDQPDTSLSRIRIHNNFFWQQQLSDALDMVVLFDVGAMRSAATRNLEGAMYGGVKVRYAILDQLKFGGRIEYMHDPNMILTTSTVPFKTVGGSLGLDYLPDTNILIRTEGRVLRSGQNTFPTGVNSKKLDAFFTIGISIWS